MSSFRVFHQHQLLAEYQAETVQKYEVERTAASTWDLVITLVDGSSVRFDVADVSAAGYDLPCGFATPDPTCPRCNQQESP